MTLEQARRKYNEMAMVTRQYLTRMGISDALYAAMLRVPYQGVVAAQACRSVRPIMVLSPRRCPFGDGSHFGREGSESILW